METSDTTGLDLSGGPALGAASGVDDFPSVSSSSRAFRRRAAVWANGFTAPVAMTSMARELEDPRSTLRPPNSMVVLSASAAEDRSLRASSLKRSQSRILKTMPPNPSGNSQRRIRSPAPVARSCQL